MTPEPRNTLYWHDYETWGEVPAQDRPAQFAGVRTDQELNIIGEPLMLYCQPARDWLPKPEACLVTGLLPQVALEKGVPEVEFVARIIAELGAAGTCGAGYNSIRFDDEVTRYALYRNFYDPYEREWRNGNSRWDLIDVVRMTRALRPEGIAWPNYEDGRPCFKLAMLTAANGLEHEAAHDALSDVYATIAMARLIKTRQPKLYDYAYRLRDKRFAATLIDIAARKPLLHISSRFPAEQGNAALVLPLSLHPSNKNAVIVYNLSANPEALLSLSLEELRLRVFSKAEDLPEGVERVALKEVHLNKTPMLLPANTLDDKTAERLQIDKSRCEQHWRQLSSLSQQQSDHLQQMLYALYSEQSFAQRTDPEQMLYMGFFGDQDKKLMAQVRRLSPQELAGKTFNFDDPRLEELLFRYRARNFPQSLSEAEQQRWNLFCYRRLTDPAAGASLVIADLQVRIAELYASPETTIEQKTLLSRLQEYALSLVQGERNDRGESDKAF